jgi:hypothetical protein
MASARVKSQGKSTENGSSSYSGRLLLRMDPALHADLARAAEQEGQSLNAYITRKLGDDVNGGPAPDPAARVAGRLIRAAIIADLVLVAVAAAIAIALLVIAWP